MQIGFTTTTLRQIKDVKKIVELASSFGADCIEWGSDIHVRDIETAKSVKALCDSAGINCCSYGTFYRVGSGSAEEWKEICEIADALGAKIIRVWLGSKNSEDTSPEEYSALVLHLKQMCAVASEYGLAVCPECHNHTFNNNTDAFLRIRSDTACDNFLTYFQSLYKRLEYDLDRIERTADYIGNIHISFSEQVREQFPRLHLGYIDKLLAKIKSVGYDGFILIEFTYYSMQHGIPFCLKNDISRLKSKVGERN